MRINQDLSHRFTKLMRDETGASLMEYALVGLLIAVVCILALLALNKST